MNGAALREVMLSRYPYDGGGGIGGEVDRNHKGLRLAAAPVGAGRIRGRGLGHVHASSMCVGRRWSK